MDSRLFDAARAGDTATLAQLLHDHPLILHQVTLTPSDSPLHVSCLLGHVDFARLVMESNNDLAREQNQQGYTPLHIASSKGKLEIVKDLLRIDREMCREEDQSGRIALHCAAMKGKTDVAHELIKAYPETASKRTPRGETMLHLAVKNNQFKALPPLFGFLGDQNMDMNEFLNSQDEDDQTILHLAVELQNLQMVKFIVNDTNGNVDLNIRNSANLTALDIAIGRSVESADAKDIEDMLRAASGGGNVSPNPSAASQQVVLIVSDNANVSNQNLPSPRFNVDEKSIEFSMNGVVVIAMLIATLAFQAALNPPGGVWQDWDGNGYATRNESSKITSDHDHSSQPAMPSLLHKMFHYIYYSLYARSSSSLPGPRPLMADVGYADRHMPGKSIARELYAENFFAFIISAKECFLLSMCTLILIPIVPHIAGGQYRVHSALILGCFVALSIQNVFDSGLALVTDTHLALWASIYVYCSVLLEVLMVIAFMLAYKRLKKLNFLKWIMEKVESWCSRLNIRKWVIIDNVLFFGMSLFCLYIGIAFDAVWYLGREGKMKE